MHLLARIGLTLSLLGSCIAFQKICSSHLNSSYTGPKLPRLPLNFSTIIEVNILNKNYSMEVTEYYDYKVNKGARIYYRAGHRIRRIYDYNTDEFIRVNETTGECSVRKMESLRFNVFGFSAGGHHIGSVADLFVFGRKFNETFEGVTNIRGIRCYHWQTCLNHNHSSYYLDYYFSKPDWKTASTMDYIPVRATINGISANRVNGSFRAPVLNTTHNFSHVYDFFSFTPGPPKPSAFQVLPGTICPGKVSNYSLPKMPDEFEFNMEIVDTKTKSVRNGRSFIDTKERLARMDHSQNEYDGNKTLISSKAVMDIHDYNTGYQYRIDRNTLDCNTAMLPNTSVDSTTKDEEHKLRIRTTEEFFRMDSNYTYEGVANIRGIPTDVFISQRPSNIRGMTQMIKWEHYISKAGWKMQSTQATESQGRVPVRLKWYGNGTVYVTNFFNFDHEEPARHILWPLRYCFWNNRHYMYFRVDGKYDTHAKLNERGVLSALRSAVSTVGKISRARVSSLLIFKSGYGSVIAVRLYVLGIPKVTSAKVLHPIHTISLADAVKNIKTAIKSGKLKITFQQSGQSVTLNSIPHSYYDGIPEPTTIPVTSDSTTNPVTSDSTTNPVTSDSTTNPGVSTSDNTATHNPTHITNFFTHITKLPGKTVNLMAQPDSYYDNDMVAPTTKPGPSNYKGLHPGQVIAIAVGVIIGAVLLTILCIHFLMKRRGVNMFKYLRHRDEPTA